MDFWLIWLIVAACLLAVEVLTQMMWALCLTAGALGAMAMSLCGLDLTWQLVGLPVIGLIAYVVGLPYFRRWHARKSSRNARTGMDALLGRHATVTHAIHPGQLGRARIDGDNWQVRAPGADNAIPAGHDVVVSAYDSIILTVEPVTEKEDNQ